MKYVKQFFEDGQVLEANHMNHIEDGLSNLDVNAVKTINGISPDDDGNIDAEFYDDTEIRTEVNDLTTSLTHLENLERYDKNFYITNWTVGRCESGTHRETKQMAYTDTMDNELGFKLHFDATKYNLMYMYCDDNGVVKDYTGWKTVSPYVVDNTKNYKYARFQLKVLDDSDINVNNLKTSTYYIKQVSSVIVEKVLKLIEDVDYLMNK